MLNCGKTEFEGDGTNLSTTSGPHAMRSLFGGFFHCRTLGKQELATGNYELVDLGLFCLVFAAALRILSYCWYECH